MIFELENKSVHASNAGQELDHKKETIIFLHGSGLSHIVWSLVEQFFSSRNYNVLSIDLPGHGNSDGKSLKSIEEISDWLEKVFNKLNISKITIVGQSIVFAASIPLLYLLQAFKSVAKFSLISLGD